MEIFCSGCDQTRTYVGAPPRFCQSCGRPFEGQPASATEFQAKTVEKTPAANPAGAESDQASATVMPDSLNATNPDVTRAPTLPPERTTAPLTNAGEFSKPATSGDQVGGYELVQLLGSGGMGVVWEAIESSTGRRVALKRLNKSYLPEGNQSEVQRFMREAQLAAQISHPKVTFIFGSGEHDEQPFIAMELMPGKTLADRIHEEGFLPVNEGVDKMIDVVEGLQAAHRIGLIHRDVKPSNCFVDTDDSVKVGDFGLSKSLVTTDCNLTQTGTFLGTPSYAAPEQVRGIDVDERTDIYSVGATLFHLLTGKTPFQGDAMAVTAQIISDRPPLMHELNESIPKDLSQAVAKCLEKEPSKRFQNLEQLRLALLPFASGRQSLADIGRRMGAFMIDSLFLQIIASIVLGGMGAYLGIKSQGEGLGSVGEDQIRSIQIWGGLSTTIFMILYFAIFESAFGRAIGKWLMGLRVVGSEGERPAFWRTLIRSFCLPGNFGLTIILLFAIKPSLDPEQQLTMNAFIMLINLIPLLACLSTMRARNQFRGLHGFLSGTRVIRLETGNQQTKVPMVQPRRDKIEKIQFGSYTTEELMGESEFGKVYLGHDQLLNRDVWIVAHDSGAAPSLDRINLSRVSRQRWLEGGTTENGARWDAYEAIKGVPIQTLVSIQHQSDWQDYSHMMLDIAEELKAALIDNTLPETLTLPQVWIDQDGHAKLLDRQLVKLVDESNHDYIATGPLSDEQKSVGLLYDVSDLLQRTKQTSFPVSAQDFLMEMQSKPEDQSSIAWTIDQLKVLSKKMGSLAWDSRLGILGLTLGIELSVYYILSFVIFLLVYAGIDFPNFNRFIIGVALSLVLPVAFGFWFRGGPVFHFMGIQVCNSRGRPVSRWRTALRSLVSWFPMAFLSGSFIAMLSLGSGKVDPEEILELPGVGIFLAFVMLAGLLVFALTMIGLIIAVISPKRGVFDYMFGTRLNPK